MAEAIDKEVNKPESTAHLRLAVTTDFLSAWARLEKTVQNKVVQFLEKFMANPRSSGINYEKLLGAKDDRVRSVRIDQQYRAIVIPPEEGNVYLMVWVAAEEDAYQWVMNRVFNRDEDANEITITTPILEERLPTGTVKRLKEGLLDNHDDETLISFGVPGVLIPAVRAVEDPDGYKDLRPFISGNCATALNFLAHGVPVRDARELIESLTSPEEEPE
jgi:hypothetical protein